MRKDLVRKSKYLSLVLRHDPGAAGIELDANGWVGVEALLAGATQAGVEISREDLVEIVRTNEKQRFSLDVAGDRIRANQGHSVAVDVGLSPMTPPPLLYHGTATRFAAAIREEGLRPMARQHVHLSGDVETARAVGQRHGRPLVLAVDAAAMAAEGTPFFRSENGVWLVAGVPARFLRESSG